MNGNEQVRSSRSAARARPGGFLEPLGVFFRGFIERPKMVASVIPSSQVTIDAMLDRVDWARCKLFVEYGPGVGTFCPHILDRLPPGGQLLVIDLNPRFIEYLRQTIDDPRFHAVLGSAADVESFVEKLGHEKADYVLSGLPISSLPEDVATYIVTATYRVLGEGGAFLTYQFRATARDMTQRHFDRTETGFVWRNVPPCILACGYKTAANN